MVALPANPEKPDGRKAARPGHGPRNPQEKGGNKGAQPTLDSLVALILDGGAGGAVGAYFLRPHLEGLIRGAQFMDNQTLPAWNESLDTAELTERFHKLVSLAEGIRSLLPGLFLSEDDAPGKEGAIAALVISRYLAAVGGKTDGSAILAVMMGLQAITGPARALLDAHLPMWQRFGDTAGAPLSNAIRPHRGNWVQQSILPLSSYLARQLLLVFMGLGHPLCAFETGGKGRKKPMRLQFTRAYRDLYGLVSQAVPAVALSSCSKALNQACAWASSGEAEADLELLREMVRSCAMNPGLVAMTRCAPGT